MTQPMPETNPAAPHEFLTNATKMDAVYAYAYGYLEGLVAEYLNGVVSAETLRGDYEALQRSVAKGVEQLMSSQRDEYHAQDEQAGGPEKAGEHSGPRTIADRYELMPESGPASS
jgi:hypothetical protein